MIKNLIFDFGKVLVDYDFRLVLDQFFKDKEAGETFFRLFTDPAFIDRCDKEEIPFEEIVKGEQRKYPQFAHELQLFYDRYEDFATGEVEGMYDLLTKLKKEGYHLYGLSNWCSKVYVVIDKYHIFELLEGWVLSSEVHQLKPDIEIYESLCNKFGLRPEECIFADDKTINVEGAEKYGMKGIVFKNARQYEAELEKTVRNTKLEE